MLGRIFIILVAFQLVVASAFAHVLPMSEDCAGPVAEQMHCEGSTDLQDQSGKPDMDSHHNTAPSGLLHCASVTCTEPVAGYLSPVQEMDLRAAELSPAEPRMALQSVIISQFRPPLA
ncbi:hypothetical protein C0U40_08110 [Amylibacter cionae]|nr:hypothetical protein C0U40_08110 [Amylibacter cionae]